ncbi:MAG TPA: DUF87 domain-containing protein, partial [Candidatus Limnocylindrales bacterium]|nr:DUF87 domain-containing protein [Candidatus Limnocylindrales bacterium]
MTDVDELFQIVLLTASVIAAPIIVLAVLQLRSRLRRFDGQLYAVAAPLGPGFPEQFFMSLHGLLHPPLRRLCAGQPWISLELVGRARQVGFQIWIPGGEKPFIESLLRAAYPGIELAPISGPWANATTTRFAQARLARGDYLPIQTAFAAEPLASLIATLARVQDGDEVTLQLLVRPKPSTWQTAALILAQRLRDGRRGSSALRLGVAPDAGPMQFERDRAKAIEDKAAGLGFDCVLRVAAAADRPAPARELLRAVAASLRPYTAANSFDFRPVRYGRRFRDLFRLRQFSLGGSFILTAPELAGLWHLPSDALPQLRVIRSPKLPPPLGANRGERTLGLSSWAHERCPVGLSVADSRHHLHLLGSTGTGKTTVMLNLVGQDIAAGRGVAVLDPKGDLVRGLLARIPRERLPDVIFISPDESDLTVGINPLELGPGDDRDLVAENTLTIFKRIYERSWGMRTDDILKSALLTLLRRPDATLAHIPLLLTNPVFRRRTTQDLRDPIGLDHFWLWFDTLSDARRGEAIGPVLNKLRDFLVRPRLRRLLCQPHSTVDLRTVVDSGQILLADLSVGRWGESTAALIGSFLVAKLWQAVLARSAIEEEQRRDFFLFIDEFQHFL